MGTPRIDRLDRNTIINGNFDIWQRGTSFAAAVDGSVTADRWKYIKVGGMVHTISRDTDVPGYDQSGVKSEYSVRLNLTTPDMSIASTDYCVIQQRIEGSFCKELATFGGTLTFWVKATLAGTYSVSFLNGGSFGTRRYYVQNYTINAANTWEKKVLYMPAIPSGHLGDWDFTNNVGIQVDFCLAVGSSFSTAASNDWQSNTIPQPILGSTSQVNGVNTGATDFRLAQVSFIPGTVPDSKLAVRDYATELAFCQRYFEKSYATETSPGTTTVVGAEVLSLGYNIGGVNAVGATVSQKVIKRTSAHTITVYNTTTGASNSMDCITVGASPSRSSTVAPSFIGNIGTSSFIYEVIPVASRGGVIFQWTADAEL